MAVPDGGCVSGVVPSAAPCLPEALTEAYLAKLGISRADVAPDLDSLTRLQEAHIDKVAWEIFDLHLPQPVHAPLDPVASAERVALQHRGGYCCILVDAYAALLRSLGFLVSLHLGGVGADPLPPERLGNHAVAVVHLDGLGYVSDVGLGEGPRRPFALRAGEWLEDGCQYRLEPRGAGSWRFAVDGSCSLDGFTVDMTRTAVALAAVEAFRHYHEFYSLSDESPFRRAGAVVHRRLPEGLLTLKCLTLKVTYPSSAAQPPKILRVLETREDWLRTLTEEFGLWLDFAEAELEELWQSLRRSHEAWLQAEVPK